MRHVLYPIPKYESMLEALQLKPLHDVQKHFNVQAFIELSALLPEVVHIASMQQAVRLVGREHPLPHLFNRKGQVKTVLSSRVLLWEDVLEIAADFWPASTCYILFADGVSRSSSWRRRGRHARPAELEKGEIFAAAVYSICVCAIAAVPVIYDAFQSLQPALKLLEHNLHLRGLQTKIVD